MSSFSQNQEFRIGGGSVLLSIGMMVKDEEKYLEECLRGLKPILDAVDSELIIVDTGSTDRTVEIAKKYTNRVYHHEWTGHFGEMRNTVLKYAKGQWFFFIDADEIIDDYTDIVNFFTSKRHKKANAAFFLLKNLLSKEDNESYGYAHMLRFFRKDKEFHFRGAVHEQPVYKPPVAHIKASAVHYGYLNDDAGLMEYKYKRNVEILEKELEKDPENIYYWFQLAQSYGMYGDDDKGLDAILKAYSIMKADKKPMYYMAVYIHLVKSYFAHEMYKKVIDICNEGNRLREGYFDLYYFQAVSHFELGDFEDALKSFEQYLEGVEKFRKNEGLVDFSVPYMTARFYDHALHYVSVIYKKLGDHQKALEYVERINDKKVYKAAIPHVVDIYMELQRFEDLKILYETKVGENGDYNEIFLFAFERYRRKMDLQQKEHWSRLFSAEHSDYGLLNSIRLLDDADDIPSSLIERIRSLDWRKAPLFYSELLWALILRNKAIISIVNGLQEHRLNALLEYIGKNNRRFASKLLDYLKDQGLWRSERPDPEKLRVKVIMLRSILVFDGLSESDYEEAFDEYVADGITNLKNLYNRDVIDNEKVSFMKTNADAFMLYMYKAKEYFQKDKVSYVRYLRKALDVDNQMKKGIQILQQRVSDALKKPQSELELHKQRVLASIEEAINTGELETAQVLISEYENIVGTDAGLCNAKAIVLMTEQKYDEAREVLMKGLDLAPHDQDMLYNMAYLSELCSEPSKAIKYYSMARTICKDSAVLSDIDEALSRLWNKTIPEFRRKEFQKRLSRVGLAKKQCLVQKENVTEDIHVVYVMAHVGVCGGSKIILEHANRLVKRGVRVSIVCHFPKPQWYPVFAEYIEVPFERELASGIPECDIIVATYWDHIQECIDINKAPVVYFEQGDFHLFDDSKISEEVKNFVKVQYTIPKFIMTVSNQVAKAIDAKFHRESRVFPNAVDEDIFNAAGHKYQHCRPYILIMGSKDLAFKGIPDVIEAYRAFCGALHGDSQIDLLWITPNKPSSVPKEVSKVFVNPAQEVIAGLYRGALMFVSGSHYEAFSLPVLEAMACGCPVVTTDNTGIREYARDKSNSLICDVKNPKQLAKAMELVYMDSTLREKLIKNGLSTARSYNWSKIVGDLLDYYKDVAQWKPAKADNQVIKGTEIMQKQNDGALEISQSELELHKQRVIQIIENSINEGDIETAKKLLDGYQDIVGVDAKACSIKSVILMVEQRFEEARQVILEGLKLEPDNSDLLYNMEYLNDLLGQAGQAASGGECSHHDTNTVEPALKSDQDSTGNANGTGYKILIASPIRQKPAILKEFLVSLRELDTSGFDIWYLFVDDNTDPESSAILNTFSKKVPNVMVHRADTGDKYVCDDVTNHQKERRVWRVAAFKDMMIKIADEYGFDYIFFIDSDLVLHPLTLHELVNSNKDIISNIFWTKWQPDAPKLPQVWLKDTYTQHRQARDEKINPETALVRRQHFLNQLKRPGIYEVGGLGACTLISRKAIKLGVSFSQIPNLSFWGEDRHFCIRAAALGLKLYVNTRYPAYHIYRESDLEGVGSYKIRAAKGEYLYKPVITLVYTSLSGSNTWALYKCVPEYIKGRFDVELVVQDNSANYYGTVMNSDVVVVTEGNYNLDKKLFNPDQIVIDLWHGFPLKSMGYADKGEKFINTLPAIWANINYIGSYSPMFNRVMEKCIRAGDEKYRVWGAPRNDLLLGSSGRDALVELLGIKNADERRFIVYMPTYRYSPRGDRNDGNKDWSNIFGLPGFDEERFNEFLRSRNLHLVVKLHPAEERKFAERIKNRSNITLLTGGKLYEKKMDLYEVLNAASLLITDYSSVYFDFLLLERPIVFVPSDRKDYARNRGFLVDDFDKWTPGPKAFNQDQLEAEIEKSVSDGNYYGTERETVMELVHSYKDANSGKRVWDFIGGLLGK